MYLFSQAHSKHAILCGCGSIEDYRFGIFLQRHYLSFVLTKIRK